MFLVANIVPKIVFRLTMVIYFSNLQNKNLINLESLFYKRSFNFNFLNLLIKINFKIMNISQIDWWEKSQADTEAIIIDVRTPEEFMAGYIPGATHINFYEQEAFINFVESLDKSKNYYVYCRSGARSGNSCALMNDMGIENAFNLTGGILDWQGPINR